MSRVSDILVRARDSLADDAKNRFTDARLIRLLNEAQLQVAVATKVLRTEVISTITPFASTICLPENCISVLRVEWEGVKLELKSHDEMDIKDKKWKATTGLVPTTVVYDLREPSTLQLWPALQYDDSVLSNLGLVTDMTGAVIADDFGVAETITGSVVIGQPTFGVLATIQIAEYSLVIQYARKPAVIVSIDDTIEVPDIFDSALKHYVVGMALRDNMDIQNRQVGQEILAQASSEVAIALRLLRSDYTAMTQYNTTYNGGL